MKIGDKIHNLEDLIGIKDCDGLNGPDQIVRRAGLDFDVYKDDLSKHDGNLDGFYAIKRSDSDRVFNIVRNNYQVIQTRETLDPFDEIVKDYGAKYTNAGTLWDGGKIWVQAELPEKLRFNNPDFDNDVMASYIMLMIDHTGTGCNAMFPYTSRAACNNQFFSFTSAARKHGLSIRHRSNWKERLEIVREAFRNAIAGNEVFMKKAEKLTTWKIAEREVRGFTNVIFPDIRKADEKREHATSQEKKREEVVNLFHRGLGNRGETRWDAFNAVTEYLDHHQGSKRITKSMESEKVEKRDNRKTFERRFISNMTGGINNNLKHRAFKTLLNEKTFQRINKPEVVFN